MHCLFHSVIIYDVFYLVNIFLGFFAYFGKPVKYLPLTMSRLLDSTAPFEFVAKNGYYTIGDQIAVHVGPACQAASRTGLPIKWHFNDEVYNKFNWRSRLNLPITELYRLRAQQLRDKYDYLILWFSGGADSTTILQSFVENNIYLDEVMIGWPRSAANGKYTPSLDTSGQNMLSEWDFSIEPKLKWLAAHCPQTKITIVDQLADPDPYDDYADTWTVVEKHTYAAINRQRLLDAELRDRYKKYKNIANIAGSSPPMIHLLNDRWLAVNFCNEFASGGVGKSDYLLDGTPRNVEYFYWTPDFPEIVREQAHIILDHINSDPAVRSLFSTYDLQNKYPRPKEANHDVVNESRRQLIKQLIYPNWDQSTFQVKKPLWMYGLCTQYQWFYGSSDSSHYLQGWRAAIKSQYSLINNELLSNTFDKTFPIFESKFYPIGRLIS